MDIDDKPSHPTKAEKKAAKKQKGENGVVISKDDSVKDTKEGKKEGKKEKKEKKKEGKVAGEVKDLEGGVKIKDVKVGSGPGAQKGQSVKMRYIGKLTDGKTFDSNTKGKPVSPSLRPLLIRLTFRQFSFRLGAGEVIKGACAGT
jgi:FK506-binding nuclear protein